MIAVVLSGFLVAVLLLFVGKYLNGKISVLFAILPLGIFSYLISLIPEVSAGKGLLYSISWIPSLGVNLDFRLDGLSLLFSLMIAGIGTLVFVYAASYLKGHRHLVRFFGYLCTFMASMLGLVLSDNLILLFVFWELTSISSFFLIAFDNDDARARKSSLMALAITGGGGFFLLAGLVMMGRIYGSYSLEAIRHTDIMLINDPLYPWLLFLVFAGAFTKSAQFPFHFWLPRAMQAPTPVSAYLHSATMVKAGIYLLARFTPLMGEGHLWKTTLLIVGGVTMLYAAMHSILRTDLKAILAYSTISALGMLVFLLGIGTEAAFIACVVFILVHALYKAALFLIAGALDHETGTRDITRLGGLRNVLLPLAVAGVLAAFSGAGIPFTFGFIGKDLIYEATLLSASAIPLTTLAVLTNILLLYAGFVVGIKPFSGKLPADLKDLHLPEVSLWFPALLLGLAGLIIGIFPQVIDQSIVKPALFVMQGMASEIPIRIWHGFNLVLLLSAITLAVGILLYLFLKPSHNHERVIKRFDAVAPSNLLSLTSRLVNAFSLRYTRVLQNGYLRSYLLTIIIFLTGIVAYKLFTEVDIYITREQWSEVSIYEGMLFALMIGAIFKTLYTGSRLTAIVSMGVVGYCICLFFVFFSAPDLAMTQFTIDTLTIVLFVLVMLRLPPFINYTNVGLKIRDGFISVLFGGLIAIIALQILNEPTNKAISRYYADNAYLEAKGKNVVNVILVDFRGFDTLVEITVLTIAAIGVYSLLKLKIKTSEKE